MTRHDFVRFLLVGFVSGWVAAILARGSVRVRGCLTYIVVGTIGAVLSGFVVRLFGLSQVIAVLVAALGAIILLIVVSVLRNA